MEKQMVILIEDQPLVQSEEIEEIYRVDPQLDSLLTMAHRYGQEVGRLMKLGRYDVRSAVETIHNFAEGLTAEVELSANQLRQIREQVASVAAAYAN